MITATICVSFPVIYYEILPLFVQNYAVQNFHLICDGLELFLEQWLFTKTEICDSWQPQWMVWIDTGCFQEGAAAHKAEDAGNPLGQAYLKYLDALVLEESKALYNFHVGRLLVTQGNYSEAVKRLEAALCWNSQHQLTR